MTLFGDTGHFYSVSGCAPVALAAARTYFVDHEISDPTTLPNNRQFDALAPRAFRNLRSGAMNIEFQDAFRQRREIALESRLAVPRKFGKSR